MLKLSSFRLKFDFYVYTTWKIQFHQRINCFLSWVNDINQTFVCTHFKLFARVFVFVSRTNDCVEAYVQVGSWDWTRNLCTLYE